MKSVRFLCVFSSFLSVIKSVMKSVTKRVMKSVIKSVMKNVTKKKKEYCHISDSNSCLQTHTAGCLQVYYVVR